MFRLLLAVSLIFAFVDFADAQTRRRSPKKTLASKAKANKPKALSTETKAFVALLGEKASLLKKLDAAEDKLKELEIERDDLLKQVGSLTTAVKQSEQKKLEAQRLLSVVLWVLGVCLLSLAGRFVWRRFRDRGQESVPIAGA